MPQDTIRSIKELNIKLPLNPNNEQIDFDLYSFPPNGKLSPIESLGKYSLDGKKGEKIANQDNMVIAAYDESINKFSVLEGTAFMTSHSLIIQYQHNYLPATLLTFYFYTRSKEYTRKYKLIKYSENPEKDSKMDYINDRTEFIISNVPPNSIAFIDGPLIGEQATAYTIKLNEKLLENNIIPIFFVKNTSSNLVTDNIDELKNKFNSDMHWDNNFLKTGERTNFFKYVDEYNPKNAKIFCYIKPFGVSPQRIEFHVNTLEKYKNKITDILDLIYYLLLLQGDPKNPQVRTIAVAEKYARTILQLVNINEMMKETGLMPTINQERFGW